MVPSDQPVPAHAAQTRRAASNAAWESFFARLLGFKRQHGHFHIPITDPEHKSLAWWATRQRTRMAAGTMPPDRLQRLEAAGFPCSLNMRRSLGLNIVTENVPTGDVPTGDVPTAEVPTADVAVLDDTISDPGPDEVWDIKYDDLLLFLQRFGHSYVPCPWPEQPALGIWVQAQRKARQAGTLSAERIARLDKLHFIWAGGWEALGADWRQQQRKVMGRFYRDPEKEPEHFEIYRKPVIGFDEDDLESAEN